jgi:hypothetical protein
VGITESDVMLSDIGYYKYYDAYVTYIFYFIRTTETALEGEKLEKRALEERCQRTVKMMESEAALRRQCEDKAARCDKATEEAARYQLEVHILYLVEHN